MNETDTCEENETFSQDEIDSSSLLPCDQIAKERLEWYKIETMCRLAAECRASAKCSVTRWHDTAYETSENLVKHAVLNAKKLLGLEK